MFNETITRKNHEANAVVGGFAPSLYEEKDRIATVLMSNILGGPAMNSVLNKVLRERYGWVYGVETSYTQYSDTGILTISLGCERENTEKCLMAVNKEILRLQTLELTERKLHAAKKQLLGQLAISSDSGENQCLSMGKSLLAFGRIVPDAETLEVFHSICAEQLRAMAERVFGEGKTSELIFI